MKKYLVALLTAFGITLSMVPVTAHAMELSESGIIHPDKENSSGQEIDISSASISGNHVTYNGKKQEITLVLDETEIFETEISEKDQEKKKNFTVRFWQNKVEKAPVDAGKYDVEVTGAGDYKGTVSGNMIIDQAQLTVGSVSANGISVTEDENEVVQKVYDGTGKIEIGDVELSGICSKDEEKDDVRIDTSDLTGDLPGADVGEYETVTISKILLTGNHAHNYRLKEYENPLPLSKKVKILQAEDQELTDELLIKNNFSGNFYFDLSDIKPETGNWGDDPEVSYTIDKVELKEGYYDSSKGEAIIEENKLVLPVQPVKSTKEELVGTITVKIDSQNYERSTLTIHVKTVNKTSVIVSGIKVADKSYDKEAVSYTGTAKAILESDQQAIDISKFKYTWLDKDGKELSENKPPVNAGKYKLLVEVDPSNQDYTGSCLIEFEISRKQLVWKTEDLKANKKDDDTKKPAEVKGKLYLGGIYQGDDVGYTYKNLKLPEFSNADPHSETLKLIIEGAEFTGDDISNYKLPEDAPSIKATIEKVSSESSSGSTGSSSGNSGGSSSSSSGNSGGSSSSSSGNSGGSSSAELEPTMANFWKIVYNQLAKIEDGKTLTVDAGTYLFMPKNVMEILGTRKNVTLVIKWNGGKTITIPSGNTVVPESTRVYYTLAELEKCYVQNTSTGTVAGTVSGTSTGSSTNNNSSAGSSSSGNKPVNNSSGSGSTGQETGSGSSVDEKADEQETEAEIITEEEITEEETAEENNEFIENPEEEILPEQEETEESENKKNLLSLIIVIAVLLIIFVFLIIFILNRRRRLEEYDDEEEEFDESEIE